MESKRQRLEWQANQIEHCLQSYSLESRVTGGIVSPRWIRFNLALGRGVRVERVRGLAEELALSLNADVCRISREAGAILLEIPRADPQPIRLLPLQKRLKEEGEMPFCTAALGLAPNGTPLLVRLPSSQVNHLLIVGTTGSGKSALARTIIASLAMNHRRSELGFVLIDPKQRAFGPLAGLPHLANPVIVSGAAAAAALNSLVALMLQRDQANVSEPRIVVVIDEIADLFASHPQAKQPFVRLAQRGREAGIHLVACTQKPTAAVMDTLARANFPVRLVGQVTSPEEAKIATGYAGTGAERLRGPGEFMAVVGGNVTPFHAAYINMKDLAQVVTLVRQNTTGRSGVTLPQVDAAAPEPDNYTKWVELVRPLWPSLLKADGKLKYGAKADIAELIFELRNTGGHYGVVVNEVIKRLRADGKGKTATALFQAEMTWQVQSGPGKTTTTLLAIWNRARRWLNRPLKVVVVVSGPETLTFRGEFPRLWAKSRVVFAVKANDRWTVTRVA